MTDRHQMTGEWLEWCCSCPVPEIANVFSRCRIPFDQITGMLDSGNDVTWTEIEAWIQAASATRILEHNRLGLIGHYYGGMLDVYSNLTQQSATFGGHIEMIEVDELAALREPVTRPEMEDRIGDFFEIFDIQPDCSGDEIERAAITSVALDTLVENHRLGSIPYYYKGTGNRANEEAISSIVLGNSLLTRRGIPVAGEYEIKNAQSMKIMDGFGVGGSFSEYYTDFKDDVVLCGHDGPSHISNSGRQS